MAETLAHRGPDDAGVWVDGEVGLALEHRRLAILDLSPAGHQPMVSACGRYVIDFNGEIYNHLELRASLDKVDAGRTAPCWRGRSDTETLLAAVAAWGFEDALKRTVGMFALALWDRQTRRLTLARDGGDELFGGYNRYFWAMTLWRRLGWLPQPLRAGAACGLTATSPAGWNRLFAVAGALLPLRWRYANPGDKLHRLAEVLRASMPEAIYRSLVSHWWTPSELVLGAKEPPTALTDMATATPEHECRRVRSLSPRPSPRGGGERRESLRDFHDNATRGLAAGG